jgi:hypothetical protein
MPNGISPSDDLISKAWQKARTIGASQVGERYLPTELPPDLINLAKRYILGMNEGGPQSVTPGSQNYLNYFSPGGNKQWLQNKGQQPELTLGAMPIFDKVGAESHGDIFNRAMRTGRYAPGNEPQSLMKLYQEAASKPEFTPIEQFYKNNPMGAGAPINIRRIP